jgi:hypothetical protein
MSTRRVHKHPELTIGSGQSLPYSIGSFESAALLKLPIVVGEVAHIEIKLQILLAQALSQELLEQQP